jgi:hypothetical protein
VLRFARPGSGFEEQCVPAATEALRSRGLAHECRSRPGHTTPPSLRKSVPQGCLIVAQYKVLGNDAMKTSPSRQGRSKRQAFGRTQLRARNHRSIVPFLLRRPDYGGQAGTDSSFKTLTQHFVPGYFQMSLPRKSFGACGTDSVSTGSISSLRRNRTRIGIRQPPDRYRSPAACSSLTFHRSPITSASGRRRASQRSRPGTSHARQEVCRPSLSHHVSSQRAVGYNFCLGWSV